MDLAIILTILGILISILIPFFGYIFKTRRQLKHYYSVIWKSSSRLSHKDLLGERPYNEYYYERKEDTLLKRQLERRNNVLLAGPPLTGKSRAVYRQLISLKKSVDVLIPRSIAMPSFLFPRDYKFWKKKYIFIDDLQYFIEKQDNYPLIFRNAKENKIGIIAACHTGQSLKQVRNKMIEQNLDIDIIFGENIIEYEKLSPETAKEIASKLAMEWDSVKFNGTIGSIFMKLSEMERRFDNCTNIEKTIMNSLRMMFITGLFSDSTFSLDWVKLTAKKSELEGKEFEWSGWLKSLEGKEFIRLSGRNKIWAEDAYLQYIVKPQSDIPEEEIFEEMILIFTDVPDALMMLGVRAFDMGYIDFGENYLRSSLKAFELALKKIDKDDILNYSKASEYAGLCCWRLARISDVRENAALALNYFSDASRVINKEEFPAQYAKLQVEIGNTYTTLAQIQDIGVYCKKAIARYLDSLNYLSPEEYPVQYAFSCNSLGSSYFLLAQVEEPEKNFKLSVEALKNALSIRTFEQYPWEYAYTCNNLGNTYTGLSEIEDKAKNIKLSIEYFNNVLKVHDKKKSPFNYSRTISNLGLAYSTLSEVENRETNLEKSISLFKEALEIQTMDKFPLQYVVTLYNLGFLYLTIAKNDKTSEQCYKAIDALEECLTVWKLDKNPLNYALANCMLGEAYSLLSEIEDKSVNYQKALNAFDEALKVYSEENHPDNYSRVMNGIANAKKVFFV